MIKDIKDKDGNIIGQLELPDDTPDSVWVEKLNSYKATQAQLSLREYLKTIYIPSVKKFVVELEEEFVIENIANGISQSGKTGGVLAVLAKKIYLEGLPEAISMMESIRGVCPSLTVTIQIIDYHINHIQDYGDLSPFITVDRLEFLKNKIKNFLGLT